MKKKITAKEAEMQIYELWQKRLLPADFTDTHPKYTKVVSLILEKGEAKPADLLALEIYPEEE